MLNFNSPAKTYRKLAINAFFWSRSLRLHKIIENIDLKAISNDAEKWMEWNEAKNSFEKSNDFFFFVLLCATNSSLQTVTYSKRLPQRNQSFVVESTQSETKSKWYESRKNGFQIKFDDWNKWTIQYEIHRYDIQTLHKQ